MEALVNNALVSMDYYTCYILAAYSASMGQRGTTKADLQSKLNAVTDQMYTVTYEVKSTQVPVENEGGDGETQETVQYVACTIHPFDQSIILKAFDVDVDATYDQFQISYGDAILNMSNALKMTMYGTAGNGSVPPISDAELNLFLASLDCSGKRKELMRCASHWWAASHISGAGRARQVGMRSGTPPNWSLRRGPAAQERSAPMDSIVPDSRNGSIRQR